MVSVEPIIIEVAKDTKESAPSASNISLARAREPLPDMGRSIAKFISDGESPSLRVTGSSTFAKISIAPDARKTPIAAKRPMSAGVMDITALNPFFVPSINVLNTFIFFAAPHTITQNANIGIAHTDMKFIVYPLLPKNFAKSIPLAAVTTDTIHIGKIIAPGLVLPAAVRIAMRVEGIS